MEIESSAAATLEMSLWHREAFPVTTSSLILIFRSLISLKAEKMKRKFGFVIFLLENKIRFCMD